MKRKIFIMSFFIFTFCFCSKNGSNNEGEAYFTLEGTVYIDNVPVPNIQVEVAVKPAKFSSVTYSSGSIKITDENGKYSFSGTSGAAANWGIRYRVRIQNPKDNQWTPYKEGNAPNGTVITEDFYLFNN